MISTSSRAKRKGEMSKRELIKLIQHVERVNQNGCKFPKGMRERTKNKLRALAEALIETDAGLDLYATLQNAFFFERRKVA